MKKISTLILAMGMAASVAAAPTMPSVSFNKTPELKGDFVAKKELKLSDNIRAGFVKDEVAAKLNAAKNMFQAPAKAEAAFGIEGEYTIGIDDSFFQDGKGAFTQSATIELVDAENSIIDLDCDYFVSDIPAIYDAAESTVTFMPFKLGAGQLTDGTTFYAVFYPFTIVVEDGEELVDPNQYTVPFDATTGEFEFPADFGFGWFAFTDETMEQALGWLEAFFVTSLAQSEPKTWTSVGNAKFQDGWVIPAYGVDQTEYEYEVELQQQDQNKNIFRLVNPYTCANCPVADMNELTSGGYIEFDLSDPDHVVFSIVEAGFADSSLGISTMYCYNALTFYSNYYGRTPAEVVAVLGDMIPYTTYKDGVVTLSHIYDAEINDETGKPYGDTYDACFGVQGEKVALYQWSDANDVPSNMDAKITFPTDFNFVPDQSAIDNIVADDANAPVEYFNLQGVKVQNPENGLYIKRQGKTVEKVVIRK